MSSLVDVIEECGALVDAGVLDRSDAIERIAAASRGGLTLLGAEGSLDRWQTIRAAYADIGMKAEMGIAAIHAKRGERP